MSIREQAANLGHEIVGKLVRHTELEIFRCEKVYLDEAQNEYLLRRGVLTIVTADGGVI